MNDKPIQLTALEQNHIALGARMVDFAGWNMPLQYDGMVSEHQWTREHAGVFDISHMGQILITGNDSNIFNAPIFLDYLCPADYLGLKVNYQRYSQFCHENGGVIDDLMALRLSDDRFLVVVNASCYDADWAHIQAQAKNYNVTIESLEQRALLALQGPQARDVLSDIIPATKTLFFMQGNEFTWHYDGQNIPLIISCSGYSGEDGYEISVPKDNIADFWQVLNQDARVKPIGLGARDSLRLEAGLPLYGHELSMDISPLEAGLSFSVSKVKLKDDARDYIGKSVLKSQYEHGCGRILVALTSDSAIPMRADHEIIDDADNVVGIVTSGVVSPILSCPIAFALIDSRKAQESLYVKIRKHVIAVKQVPSPFVAHNYIKTT